jgi:BirA family transcriptional regulator, biotin operon repressor / biotin---[acetyl-CoA-carboxylase] ligase
VLKSTKYLYKIPANTLFAGKRLVFMPSCHSTNTLAMEMVRGTATMEGTVVITHEQTAGRGQLGASWIAEPGKNLTLSLILKPGFLPLSQQHYFTMAIALGIYDVLSMHCDQVAIKWPNDLYVGHRKIGGILIENTLKGSFLDTSVVGIGLNVNQTMFGLPHATSLCLATGTPHSLPHVFEHLMECLEKRYLQLRGGHTQALRDTYHRVLYRRGQPQDFIIKGKPYTATVQEVDDLGRLVVHGENGLESFQNKEIEWVLPTPSPGT